LFGHLIFYVQRIIQPMSVAPFVSVIIVTWNSKKDLLVCLTALSAQTNKDFEIVVLDNGSTDEGCLGLEDKYSDLHLTIKELNKNFGFAIANNIGARLARGKWLALLNADAFPEPDWLDRLIEAAEAPGTKLDVIQFELPFADDSQFDAKSQLPMFFVLK